MGAGELQAGRVFRRPRAFTFDIALRLHIPENGIGSGPSVPGSSVPVVRHSESRGIVAAVEKSSRTPVQVRTGAGAHILASALSIDVWTAALEVGTEADGGFLAKTVLYQAEFGAFDTESIAPRHSGDGDRFEVRTVLNRDAAAAGSERDGGIAEMAHSHPTHETILTGNDIYPIPGVIFIYFHAILIPERRVVFSIQSQIPTILFNLYLLTKPPP